MLKKILLGTAALLLANSSVQAADYETAPAAYDWTGFYLGIHGGAAWGDVDATEDTLSGGLDYNGDGNSWSADTSGFVGGLQAGYNWQASGSALVFGVEGDLGWLGADGDETSPLAETQGSGTRVETDGGFYGTARLRAGIAADNLLFYATGGLIFADVNAQITDPVFVPAIDPSEKTGIQTGWTVGGGAEWGHGAWSVKAEYLYYDLGTENVFASHGAVDSGHSWDIDTTGHIARVGLNFRF